MARFLIAMDIDDTQIRDRVKYPDISDDDVEGINQLKKVLNEASQSGSIIFHVTGGILSDFTRFKTILPASDYLSCAAATQLYMHDSKLGEYRTDDHFSALLSSMNFSEDVAINLGQKYESLTPLLGEHKNSYKISFIIDPSFDLVEAGKLADAIRKDLSSFTDMGVTLVSAGDVNYLDITPRLCTKGSKVDYIAQRHGINPENIIVFGNGGNDISMFKKEFKAVAVGNAGDSLKAHVGTTAKDGADHLIAHENYSRGVVEGLRHFGVVS